MVGFNANDRSAWFFGVMNREMAVGKLQVLTKIFKKYF